MKYLPVIFILFLAGCDFLGHSGRVTMRLTTDQLSYQAGQELTLTLMNLSDVSYNVHPDLCGVTLFRMESRRWQPVVREEVCTEIVMLLEPGKSLSTKRTLESTLPEGLYRYMYLLSSWRDGGPGPGHRNLEVYTPPFQVIR